MGSDSHAQDAHDSHNINNDVHDELDSLKPVAQGGPFRVEAPQQGKEAAGVRRPSSGLISLCVVAGHHQRAADPLQLARALGLDPTAELSEARLILVPRSSDSELSSSAPIGVVYQTIAYRSLAS
jgi:hypothetical protein